MTDPFHVQDGSDDGEPEYDDAWDIDDEEEEAAFEEDEEDDWVDWEDDDAFYAENEAPYEPEEDDLDDADFDSGGDRYDDD